MNEVSIGRDVNLTLRAGVERTYRVKGRDSVGGEWSFAGLTFNGAVEDVERHVKEGELDISSLADGSILVKFPGLSRGRYAFYVDGVSEDGETVRLLNGYVGYDELGSGVYVEAPLEVDRVLTVTQNNEVRRVLYGRTSAAEEYAVRAELARDSVAADAEIVRQAKGVVGALQRGVREAFTIGNNGNWHVGGEDTGKPSRGVRGMNADDIQYHEIATPAQLPTDAEHCNPRHRYIVRSQTPDEQASGQYLWVDGAWRLFPLTAPTPATVDNHGLALLSTDEPVANPLRIGNNAEGQLVAEGNDLAVQRAGTYIYGTVCYTDGIPGSLPGVPSGMQVYQHVQGEISDAKRVLRGEISQLDERVDSRINEAVENAFASVPAFPVGTIVDFAGDTAPDGWLLCDGSEVAISDYSTLFALIGNRFGIAADADRFKLPDMRGRFPYMPSDSERAIGTTEEASIPNITGRFVADNAMDIKSYALWQNQTSYKAAAEEESTHAGCFLGVFYHGSGYAPTEYRKQLIDADSERFAVMDTTQQFVAYDASNNLALQSPVGNVSGDTCVRMTFDASRCSQVFKNGADTVLPRNIALNKIIKY